MRRIALLAGMCALAACSPPPTALPRPTPQSITVAYSPALRPATEALNACAIAQPEIALLVEETPAAFLDVRAADLVLWLGEPAEANVFAAPLAREEIVVIVHLQNRLDRLTRDELRAIFSGQGDNWQELGGEDLPMQAWFYPEGNEIRQRFETAVMKNAWPTSLARLAPDPEAMLEAIGGDPAAIGYLPRAYLSAEVKTVHLDQEVSGALRLPVLALAAIEPQGALRAFLVCLQSGEGKTILEKHYQGWSETNSP